MLQNIKRRKTTLILLLGLLLLTVLAIQIVMQTRPVGEESKADALLSSFESKRTRGGELGGYGTVQETSSVLMNYAVLGKPIPNPQEVVDYLDSRTSAWAAPPSNNYWTTRVWWALAAYKMLDATPADAQSTKGLFSRIDTWDEALADTKTYAPTNFWGDMWAKITAWRLYYGVPPPWMDQYFSYSEAHVDSWMPDIHQRTHNFFVYWAQGRQMPNTTNAVDRTLVEQRQDGSWDGSAGSSTETTLATTFLNKAAEQAGRTAEAQAALSKTRALLQSLYTEQSLPDGVNVAGFKMPSDTKINLSATTMLTGAAVELGLLPGQTDVLTLIGD